MFGEFSKIFYKLHVSLDSNKELGKQTISIVMPVVTIVRLCVFEHENSSGNERVIIIFVCSSFPRSVKKFQQLTL